MSRDDDNLIYVIAFGLWLFWKYAGSSTVVITDPGTGQPVGTDPTAPVTPVPDPFWDGDIYYDPVYDTYYDPGSNTYYDPDLGIWTTTPPTPHE